MTRKTATWMPLYWGDYLRDTVHLDTLEHGAYLLLIAYYWTNGNAIADDNKRLATIARLTPEKWAEIRPTIEEFFTIKGEKWHHGRVDAEIKTAETKSHARSEAGKRGAEARWQPHSNANALENSNRIATAPVSQWQNDAPSPSQVEEKPKAEALVKNIADIPNFLKAENRPNAKPKRKKPKRPIPTGWQPLTAGVEYAAARGISGEALDAEVRQFKNNHDANGRTFASFDAAWRNWCDIAVKIRTERMADRPKHGGIVAGTIEDIAMLEGEI